ncbi:MAG TPA: hypothetical protein VFI46_11905 [Jiangellaceae bacterium]|nr:hypothetical protein [Jiangellaceae bacterium]
MRDTPVAFAGIAVDVGAESVTIDVDRRYAGGAADRVAVGVPDPQTAVSLNGVQFVEGQRYLLTATDGTVKGCGFGGPVTPDLEQAFAEAFGG